MQATPALHRAAAFTLFNQHSTPAVFSAFCISRLGGDWGYAFGTLPSGVDFNGIIARAMPQ